MNANRVTSVALKFIVVSGLLTGCASEQPDEGPIARPGAVTTTANRSRLAVSGAPRPTPQIAPITQITTAPQTPPGLVVPTGFRVNVFAEGLKRPRRIVIAPGGTPAGFDLFVAELGGNRIQVLRDRNGDGVADSSSTFTNRVTMPYGLAFAARFLYVGNTDSIVRFPYTAGATTTAAIPQKMTTLTVGGYRGHWTRNLLFDRTGTKLYFTVGSSCNTCEETDHQRAAISVMNLEGTHRRIFASGMRNPVGMAWRPGTNELWTVVNERDWLGDDTPPDYLTRVKDGAFYGWPYAYTTIDGKVTPDPQFGKLNLAKVKTTKAPTMPVQAHSASLGVAFYPKIVLPSGFPPEYRGDAFLTFHGSWNRSQKTGYKLVRVHFENGRPVSITDFAHGFLREDGTTWGRPVDVAVAPDGSLLFSDDHGNRIWRISYDTSPPSP